MYWIVWRMKSLGLHCDQAAGKVAIAKKNDLHYSLVLSMHNIVNIFFSNDIVIPKSKTLHSQTAAWGLIQNVLASTYCTCIIHHRSIQSQLQTKNVQAIWHMPNYSLISWVPKTGKNKKFQRKVFSGGPIK